MDPWLIVLLAIAAFCAGFVDAIVGGGGLIQLPALVIAFPQLAPVQLLATNKLSSFCGTTVSAATYYRRVSPDAQTFVPLMLAAFAGSVGGAFVASSIPRSAFDPILLVVLVAVGAWVLVKPSAGNVSAIKLAPRPHLVVAVMTGVVVGFYDGALGPGTGSFFVVALVGLLGYSFLEATAKARMANWATNLAALMIFVPQGAVMWTIGLTMGMANLAGGYVGTRTAVARGAGFVRVFLMVVVAAFTVRIGGQSMGLW